MRIVIAEDAAVIRAGLAEILADRGHEVAAAVGDAEALKAAVAEHKPDVAIVDVRMPPDHTDEGPCSPTPARDRSICSMRLASAGKRAETARQVARPTRRQKRLTWQ